MSKSWSLNTTRRHFLQQSALAVGGLVGTGSARSVLSQTVAASLSAHRADVTGSGQVTPADVDIVQRALFARRGSALRPRPDFDVRADVFGRGSIGQEALEAVRLAVENLAGSPAAVARRPITVAWHYGWYNQPSRRAGLQTVRFKGGDYASWDVDVETLFNEHKNEFGITVDALSWIPAEQNRRLLSNYRQGIFQSPNFATRHVALLYESTIGLPVTDARINFLDPSVPALVERHFGQMAQFLLEAQSHGARPFVLDGRPVMFIYGSHIWGSSSGSSDQLDAVDRAFDFGREAFHRVYGAYPYAVGEEMSLSARDEFSVDRQRRTPMFDAIHIYHHASHLKPTMVALGDGANVVLPVSQSYVDNQIVLLERTYAAVETIRNRFTGQRVLVIPNLAPGFAKPGLPTLTMGRADYADFMRALERVHVEQYVDGPWAADLGTAALPAPIYIVGSWNEEFEGHALLPAAFNFSLPEVVQAGFDLPMAVKEVFGWNHYAQRDIWS